MAKPNDIADVLVIGSGASGGAFSWSVSREPGLNVVCLEQGDWIPEPEFSLTTDSDREYKRITKPEGPPGIKTVTDGFPMDLSGSEWPASFHSAVGGSTVHYAGLFSRLHPSDFRVRTLDGIADDWPISYWDLEPYYDLNDRMTGIAGLTGNTSTPPRSPRQNRAHGIGVAGDILASGFNKLGWHFWPADAAVLSEPYGDGREACTGFCFSCNEGCYKKAKARTDVTYWPEAIRNGVHLITRARVREVTVNKEGKADGALYYDSEGQLHHQKARVVVMACNGLGTPRILLNSKSPLFPDGLANTSGQVGKNLMCHPIGSVTGLFEEDLDAYMGPRACSLISEEFYETDASRGFVRGHSWLCGRGGAAGPLGTALGSAPGSSAAGGVRLGGSVPWGENHHRVFDELFNHTLGISALGDDLPEEINRLELATDLVDQDGIPGIKVIVRRSENSKKLVDHSIETGRQLLEAAGAKEIIATGRTGGATGHYLGTCRMGVDPSRSVIDGWGAAHDVKNLFVIDGSTFVTSGTVTPTSTIQAIALRTADYVQKNARNL